MFELVLIVCLWGEQGESCFTETAPETVDLETCQRAGDWLAQRATLQLAALGAIGRVGWLCRKPGVEL